MDKMRGLKKEEKNQNKKLVSFRKMELVNGYYQDRAVIDDTSYSATIEAVLLSNILTGNTIADNYIESIYTHGLKDTFISLYQNLSAGIEFGASADNAYALVKLSLGIVSRPFSSGVDFHYEHLTKGHFASNCEQVKRKLEYEANKRDLSFDKERQLEDDIALLSATINNSVEFVPYNYFKLVLKNWDYLGNNTFTFRMLFDVTALSDAMLWETPENRLKAKEIIAEVTKTWDL